MMNGDQSGSAGVYGSFPRNDLIWPERSISSEDRRGSCRTTVVGWSDDGRGTVGRQAHVENS